MKNFNLLRFAAFCSLFAILLSSCTKDSLKSDRDSKNAGNPQINTDNIPSRMGSIQASVTDGTTSVSLVVYNDDYNSGEVFADDQGVILASGIPPGTYTVVAHVLPDDEAGVLKSILFENVTVFADQTTDLGEITFQ